RVTGTAATRDDREAQIDAGFHDRADLFFGVRIDDDEWIFDTPIRRIGDVRYACETVELDVVLVRDARETRHHFTAQLPRLGKLVLESVDGLASGGQKAGDALVAAIA